MNILLPTAYCGNIYYYALLAQAESVAIETHEHWQKQSYRNRCIIYGANGPLNLIAPIKHKKKQRQTISDIAISNDEQWQKLHWRSLESAYRASPYFEYYEHALKPFFEKQHEKLLELNNALHLKITELLKLQVPEQSFTEEYIAKPPDKIDYRNTIHPKKSSTIEYPEYIQVFGNKFGFLPNLSILDLMFNEGPNSGAYLKGLHI